VYRKGQSNTEAKEVFSRSEVALWKLSKAYFFVRLDEPNYPNLLYSNAKKRNIKRSKKRIKDWVRKFNIDKSIRTLKPVILYCVSAVE